MNPSSAGLFHVPLEIGRESGPISMAAPYSTSVQLDASCRAPRGAPGQLLFAARPYGRFGLGERVLSLRNRGLGVRVPPGALDGGISGVRNVSAI